MYSDKHVSNLVNFHTICVNIIFFHHFFTIQYIVDLANICFHNELSINRGTIHYLYFPKYNKTYYYLFHFWFETRYLWFGCLQTNPHKWQFVISIISTKPSAILCLLLATKSQNKVIALFF